MTGDWLDVVSNIVVIGVLLAFCILLIVETPRLNNKVSKVLLAGLLIFHFYQWIPLMIMDRLP